MDLMRQKTSDRVGSTQQSHGDFYGSVLKRALDLVLALMLLLPLAPIVAMLYLLTRLEGGSGFFGHERVGRDGRSFRCWKIRTMRPDAQALLEAHLAANPDAAAEWQRDFKLTDDPRVTRVGGLLRSTSLDELPQIWNVLRGEMSFVGPRPVTRAELEKYSGFEWCYLSTTPGITGLWQVSGRNDVDYDQRVQLDMQYLANRSLRSDISILLRTFGAVVNRTGR